MVLPTALLWLYAIAHGIVAALSMPKRAEIVDAVALSLVVSLWVIADARKRRRTLCYDYDSFVYFLWLFILPVYLFQTRGLRAFLTLLCCIGLCFLAVIACLIVYSFRQ